MIKIITSTASEGLAKGKLLILKNVEIDIPKSKIKNVQKEIKILDLNVEKTILQLNDFKKILLDKNKFKESEIFQVHIDILRDPSFINGIKNYIQLKSSNLVYAIEKVKNSFVKQFSQIDDAYIKERIVDIKEVSTKLIRNVLEISDVDLTKLTEDMIIFSNEFTSSQITKLQSKHIKGIISVEGSPTSHSAIIAKSLELPYLYNPRTNINNLKNDDIVIIDSYRDRIVIDPTDDQISDYTERLDKIRNYKLKSQSFIKRKTVTKDGHTLLLKSNINDFNNINDVRKFGSEGIGLFRTEFMYMDSKTWPTEQFQKTKYLECVSKKHSVYIRTLDIAKDKVLSYYKMKDTENTFLGVRGIRFQMLNIEIFKTQIDALLKATINNNLGIMIPMISNIDELRKVIDYIKGRQKRIESKGYKIGKYKIGIMVEVPSVIEIIDKFSKYVDFFSIGTNDLIQYTFAIDREISKIDYLNQPYNPAILRQINKVAIEGLASNTPVSICGELSREVLLLPFFIGCSISSLSMASNLIPFMRYYTSLLTKSSCEILVKDILDNCETEEEVINKLKLFFKEHKIDLVS